MFVRLFRYARKSENNRRKECRAPPETTVLRRTANKAGSVIDGDILVEGKGAYVAQPLRNSFRHPTSHGAMVSRTRIKSIDR
jgi:hypothetical protein